MCQSKYFQEFQHAVSAERLEPYIDNSPKGDQTQAFAAYLWNITLCESLYVSLNGLEIALRNSIHDATEKSGIDIWFKGSLKAPEEERLDRWRKRTDPHGKKTLKAGDIVAGMDLGFWVDLFKGRYEQILWPALLPNVFPFATKKQRHREGIFQRLARIQRLRNRVFHHEPVWHLPDLPDQHQVILETIGWISPAMLEMTRLLDRFDSVYTTGADHYARELDSVAQNWGA